MALSPAIGNRLDSALATDLARLSAAGQPRIRSHIRSTIVSLDPAGEADREAAARRERHIKVRASRHGMGVLSAHIPLAEARAIQAVLMDEAAARRTAALNSGCAAEPASALGADYLVDRVLGRGPENANARTIQIGIVLPASAALHLPHYETAEGARGIDVSAPLEVEPEREGLRIAAAHPSVTPAWLPGGEVMSSRAALAFIANELDRGSMLTYCRVYADPASGELVSMDSRARAFPSLIAKLIRMRDGTCRAPWCSAPVNQIDHIIPHARGGPTHAANAQGLCQRCNLAKEAMAGVHKSESGSRRCVTWETPHGYTASTSALAVGPRLGAR